jgi:hypothetical protein
MTARLTRIDTSAGQQIADRLLNPAPTPRRLALARRHADLVEKVLGTAETTDAKRMRFIREQHEAADAIEAALADDGPAAA